MPATYELRLAQLATALAGCAPVLAGTAGILLGPAMTGAAWDPASDSHFRYLSGLLLGIGLAFWSCIPALPHRTNRFRLLSAIVILGGLARLLALPLHGWPGTPMAFALVMELAVVPLLCLWQARLPRTAKDQHLSPGFTPPTLPPIAVALLAATILASSQPALANDPGPPDSLRIGPIEPEWMKVAAEDPSRLATDEHKLSRTYPDRILRWGNLLALKLNNGKFAWLVDMQGPAEGITASEHYHLHDYWPDLGQYIVQVTSMEWTEYWLISSQTASVTKILGEPYRDRAITDDFIASGTPGLSGSVVQVWEMRGGSWSLQYQCFNHEEEAGFLRWETPDRVILAQPDPQHRTREFVLTKSNGQWHTDSCRDP